MECKESHGWTENGWRPKGKQAENVNQLDEPVRSNGQRFFPANYRLPATVYSVATVSARAFR